MQSQGAEVIHLGHDRSVDDVLTAALQEDADMIAVSSYQGGHLEFFRYLIDRLRDAGAGHIRVYGGGGGVISPEEVAALHAYGVTRIFRPEDGQKIGLAGMIAQMLEPGLSRPEVFPEEELARLSVDSTTAIARLVSFFEARGARRRRRLDALRKRLAARRRGAPAPVVGFTGTGGAGKSTLVDELVRRFWLAHPGQERGRALDRSDAAHQRRRAARRPAAHERDPPAAGLRALARDASRAPRALVGGRPTACACCRPRTST